MSNKHCLGGDGTQFQGGQPGRCDWNSDDQGIRDHCDDNTRRCAVRMYSDDVTQEPGTMATMFTKGNIRYYDDKCKQKSIWSKSKTSLNYPL